MPVFAIAAIGFTAASSIFGARSARKSAKAQARHARSEGLRLSRVYLHNAKLDEINEREVIRKGFLSLELMGRQASSAKGETFARSAVAGASVGSASVQSMLLYQDRVSSEQKKESVREANLQATSFAGQRVNNIRQSAQAIIDGNTGAILARRAGNDAAVGSLLSGGANIASIANSAWGTRSSTGGTID